MEMTSQKNPPSSTVDTNIVEGAAGTEDSCPSKLADADSPLVTQRRGEDTESQDSQSSQNSGEGDKHLSVKCRYRLYRHTAVDDKEITAKLATKAFVSRASLVGFTQIHESLGALKKTFWAAVSVAALACLLLHTCSLIIRFSKFEKNIELKVVTQKHLDFPAVTVCNNNMLRDNKAPPYIGRGIKNVDDIEDYLALNNPSLGHQKEDLIVWASFDNNNLTLDDFELVLNSFYGNCYTFNMKGTYRTRRALPGYGLQLIINAEAYHYNNQKRIPPAWKGVVVKVHPPGTEAIVEEGGVPVGVSSLSNIFLKKKELQRLGGIYGVCLEGDVDHPSTYYQGTYTKEQCDNTCLQHEVISKCCCYIKTMNRNLSEFDDIWSGCSKGDVIPCEENSDCLQRIWSSYDDGGLKCDFCIEECRESVYDVRAVAVDWPTQTYFNKVLVNELNSNQRLQEQMQLYGQVTNHSLTEEEVKESLLMIQIAYESMTTTRVTEVPVVAVAEFCSELSSAIGFWVGWSFWTALQFSEFLSDLIVIGIRCRRRQKEKPQTTVHEEL